MPEEHDILNEILKFFSDKFETRTNIRGFKYAQYKKSWLNEIGLKEESQDEAKTAQTIKRLQEKLTKKFGDKRVKIEAKVAENMKLRFESDEDFGEFDIDTTKLMAFDIVESSPMIKQYISLARLYKLEIKLIDIYPECNV